MSNLDKRSQEYLISVRSKVAPIFPTIRCESHRWTGEPFSVSNRPSGELGENRGERRIMAEEEGEPWRRAVCIHGCRSILSREYPPCCPSLSREKTIYRRLLCPDPSSPLLSLSSNDKSTPTRCKPRRNGATEWLVVVAAMVDRPRPRARVPFAGDINLD